MRFTPKTEQEVSRIFEKGNYRYKVIDAFNKPDKNNDNMLVLKLQFFHNSISGKTTIVDCYLTANPNFEFLIRHFSYSCGLDEYYEKGELPPEVCKDREGVGTLGISVDEKGKYPDKNVVRDFIVATNTASFNVLNNNISDTKEHDDDIPF
jgi:hypothetical protein